MKEKVELLIDHIDPLGQGVAKNLSKVTFVSKVLPDETVLARVSKEKSKIQFAELESVSKPSEMRVQPDCPHFDSCNGCHFLHTNYDFELEIKKKTLIHQLKQLGQEVKINQISSSSRFGMRNRIQLHYDKKAKQLGFMKKDGQEIVPVPSCQLPNSKIQKKLNELYQDNMWLNEVPKNPNRGHIEILETDSALISVKSNDSYSHGGFRQVNEEINQKLLFEVNEILKESSSGSLILDLFGGSGNLTKRATDKKCLVIDKYIDKSQLEAHQRAILTNLYNKKALSSLKSHIDEPVEVMLIDPPRSGLKNLEEFVMEFIPKRLIYVSCNPSTMVRDLKEVTKNYKITHVHQLDMFPGTYHFETLISLISLQ